MTRAKRYNPHRQSNCQTHGYYRDKVKRSSLPKPNKYRVSSLQEAHGNAEGGKQILPRDQRLRRKLNGGRINAYQMLVPSHQPALRIS
jgi:hypothetical protein